MRVTDRDLRPLAVTGAVALGSVGLLVLAVGQGWLGADVGRGGDFCEAARDGAVRQPANAFSNAGFVAAGLLVAWRAGRASALGDVLSRPLATAYACVVVLLGPASAAMHATQSALGGDLDLLSMYLVASFAAGYALMRLLRRGPVFFTQVFLLLVAGCQLVGLYPHEVPVVVFAGNVAFGVLLITAITIEVRLSRRGPARTDLRWGAAALLVMVVAFAIWNASQHGLCDPRSLLQGHAVWHLLGAASAYLLFRLWASERSGCSSTV